MARRPRTKRPRDDSDDEESGRKIRRHDGGEALSNAPSPAPESDGEPALAAVEGAEDDDDDENALPPTPKGDSKRKNAKEGEAPATTQEDAELARRRRRRQSLVFQKRRQSLTPSKPTSGATSDDGEPRANRQYISDMYSTIIKMSSENKINIKNTWSLHLIDHMEDILSAPQVERAGEIEDPNTFNFQKASCTLDASIKIYSYRVDDTWTSSYKILENLSRSGGEKRAENDEGDEDDEDGEGGEEGEEGTQRRKKKTTRKQTSAAKTIEKNLNNITLKSYELDFEPDPLFHKMSQTFDEGGAKGMLLANLGVYDGAKILLNSADVRLATRKAIPKKVKPVAEDGEDDEAPTAEEPVKPQQAEKIDLSVLGKLSCFSKDVTLMSICPPLRRLYDQIEEMRDPDSTQSKIVPRQSVLTLATRREKVTDDEAYVPSTPAPGENFAVTDESAETDDGDAAMDATPELPPLTEEADGGNDTADDDDDADDNNDHDDQSFEFGGPDDMDVEMDDGEAASSVSATDASAQVEETPANDAVPDAEAEDNEPVTERHVDPVTHLSDEPKPVVIKSAADYFRAQMEDDSVKNEEDMAYSQLIETALMRSVILEAEGTESTDRNDYSYFDAKLLKNWAGPSHLKFRGARRLPKDMLAFADEQEEGTAPAKRGRKPQAKKNNSVAAEKRSLVVDFHSDAPDLAKLLKVPKTPAATILTKLVIKRQMQKSAELVFPVDAHIESTIFFRHFLKPRLQLFHRRLHPSRGMEVEETQLPSASDPGLADTDNLAFEDSGVEFGHDFGGGFSDDEDSDNDIGREGSTEFFSSANLIAAERVVEKVDVHYERVAKRVDVKKLKTSLWSHLESETALLGKRKSRLTDAVEPDPESSEEESHANIEPTTFENVVQGIAGKVPSNVTVSFYFICMLHLANEKGLRLTGKEDLSDFAIKKEEALSHH